MRRQTLTHTGADLQHLNGVIIPWDGFHAPRALLVALAGAESVVGPLRDVVTVRLEEPDGGRQVTWKVFARSSGHFVTATYGGPANWDSLEPPRDGERASVEVFPLSNLTKIRLTADIQGVSVQHQSGTFAWLPTWTLVFGEEVVELPNAPVADGSCSSTDLIATLNTVAPEQ